MRIEIEVPIVVYGKQKTSQALRWAFASVPQVFDIPEYSTSDVQNVLSITEEREEDVLRHDYFGVQGQEQLYTVRSGTYGSEEAKAFHWNRYKPEQCHPFFETVQEQVQERLSEVARAHNHSTAKHVFPESIGTYRDEWDADHASFRFSTLPEIGIRHFYEDSVDQQIETFARRMERFICVDGIIMVTEQEPAIGLVGYTGFGRTVRPQLILRREPTELVNLDDWSLEKPMGFLAISDFDSVDERVAEIAETLASSDLSKDASILNVEVHDQSYLKLSGEALTLVASADLARRSFLEAIGVWHHKDAVARNVMQTKLLGLGTSQLDTFQKLVAGLQSSDESHASEELETAVSLILETPAPSGMENPFGNERIILHLASSMERWQDRFVDLDVQSALAYGT